MPRTRRPALLNAAQHWLRIGRFTDHLEPLGDRFVVRMPGTGVWLGLTHPDDIEKVFRAPGSAVHLGEALRMVSPHELVLGPTALTSLDGERHHTQRRMLLPMVRSDALKRYEPEIEARARDLVRAWPVGRPTAALPYAQRVTLEIIMAVIFGVTDQGRLDRLRRAVLDLMNEGGSPRFLLQMMISQARKEHYERPFPRIERRKAAIDAIVREEIADRADRPATRAARPARIPSRLPRRSGPAPERTGDLRPAAAHADRRPRHHRGHHRVGDRADHPHPVGARVNSSARSATVTTSYLDAVIMETLRLRPVFPFTIRLTKQPLQLDGLTVPAETFVVPYITLVHRRPDIYPDPLTFRPERFLGTRPGAYSWIPFGGGARRCIGAPLATQEARIVLRTLIQELDLRAVRPQSEALKRKAVIVVPAHGGQITASRSRGRAATASATAESAPGELTARSAKRPESSATVPFPTRPKEVA